MIEARETHPPYLHRRKFLQEIGTAALIAATSNPITHQESEANSGPNHLSYLDSVSPDIRNELTIWNAASAQLFTPYASGRGYIACNPTINEKGEEVLDSPALCSIKHVIDSPNHTKIEIRFRTGPADNQYYPIKKYSCADFEELNRPGDQDPSVVLRLSEEDIESIQRNIPIKPLVRMKEHPSLIEGSYIATPASWFKSWTLYRIDEISENELILNILNGQFCKGLSGTPAILCQDPGTRIDVQPILTPQGKAIVVAESQGIFATSDTQNCSEKIAANRVS